MILTCNFSIHQHNNGGETISSSIANLADDTARKPNVFPLPFQSLVGGHLDQQRIRNRKVAMIMQSPDLF
jgi:hypothetical protein